MKFFTCSLLLVLAVSLQADWKSTGDVLVSGNGATGSNFGYSVDVGKKYAVVGAKDEGAGSGAAYVFQKEDNGSWTKQMQLPNPNSSITTSGFGASVAIAESSASNANPDFIVVGAPESYIDIGSAIIYRGEICIYERNSTSNLWEQHQACIVEASNTLGFSVDVSNYTEQGLIILDSLAKIVAGDPGNDTNKTDAGAVYFYDYDTSSDRWSLNETAYAPAEDGDSVSGMQFGYSVAVDRNISFIGAPYKDFTSPNYEDGAAYGDAGAVLAYNTDGEFLGSLEMPVVNLYGISVDFDGNYIVTGGHNGPSGLGFALILQYNPNSGILTYLQTLESSSSNAPNDNFAQSVAICRNHIAIGAPTEGIQVSLGAVYIYDKNESGLWEKSATYSGKDEALFGNSVSLYSDTLMVGAPGSEEVQVYDYSEPMEVNPALIMYLLN